MLNCAQPLIGLAMRELIKALKSHSVTEKRNAVLALANLAANAENQERIAQAAGIAPLVSLLSDSDRKHKFFVS